MYVDQNNKWKPHPGNESDHIFFRALIKTLNVLARYDSITIDEHGMAWITYSNGMSLAVEIEILPNGTFQQSVANESDIKNWRK